MPPTPVPATRPTAGEVLAAWVQATRPKFFVVSVVPVALGLVLAAREGPLDPVLAAWTLVGSLLVHTVANFANDYYDWIQYRGPLPYRGGSGVLQDGRIAPATMRRATLLVLALSAAIGAWLASRSHPSVYAFTALGLLSAFYYTAPPVRYGYRGLAELGCGLSMGPLIVLGAYTVQTGRPAWHPVLASLPLASLVALILYAESIHDIEEDRATGKRTLAARLGPEGALRAYAVWVLLTAAYLVVGAASGLLPRLAAAAAIPTLPVTWAIARLLRQGYREEDLYAPGRWSRRLYLLTGALLLLGAAGGW